MSAGLLPGGSRFAGRSQRAERASLRCRSVAYLVRGLLLRPDMDSLALDWSLQGRIPIVVVVGWSPSRRAGFPVACGDAAPRLVPGMPSGGVLESSEPRGSVVGQWDEATDRGRRPRRVAGCRTVLMMVLCLGPFKWPPFKGGATGRGSREVMLIRLGAVVVGARLSTTTIRGGVRRRRRGGFVGLM